MDNSDEYVLQVFRRAQMMLEESLGADEAGRLAMLAEKLERSSDLRAEAEHLKYIEGFSRTGIAFDWLLERSKRDAEFNLDQFDADVHVLHTVLRTGLERPARTNRAEEEAQAAPAAAANVSFALPEPDWNSALMETSPASAPAPDEIAAELPSFIDLLDHPMVLTVRRLADSASLFGRKPEAERATALAVLKMMAKSIVDMARPQNKIVVMSTFQEIAGLMESIERRGSAREEETERIITELGRMISDALAGTEDGIGCMNGIVGFINEHKATGSK